MSHLNASLFGAIAGFSIFVGLPVARFRLLSNRAYSALTALATGLLIFILWDVLIKADVPVEDAVTRSGGPHGAVMIALFLGGISFGYLALVYVNVFLRSQRVRTASTQLSAVGSDGLTSTEIVPGQTIAVMIAVGLGLHNLSEGLAIGQAAATGAVGFAAVLVIGFGIHNVTEGFGIAAPMAGDANPPSWRFLALVGLIGGGPTAVGTALGYTFESPYAFVLFLTLAAGALIYVIGELFALLRRSTSAVTTGWALVIGFATGYATELVLTQGGL